MTNRPRRFVSGQHQTQPVRAVVVALANYNRGQVPLSRLPPKPRRWRWGIHTWFGIFVAATPGIGLVPKAARATIAGLAVRDWRNENIVTAFLAATFRSVRAWNHGI